MFLMLIDELYLNTIFFASFVVLPFNCSEPGQHGRGGWVRSGVCPDVLPSDTGEVSSISICLQEICKSSEICVEIPTVSMKF